MSEPSRQKMTMTGEPSSTERLQAAVAAHGEASRAIQAATDNLSAAYAEADETVRKILKELAPEEWSSSLSDITVGILVHEILASATGEAARTASAT